MESRRNGPQLSSRHDDDDDEGRSRSSMLVPPKRSSAVLVVIGRSRVNHSSRFFDISFHSFCMLSSLLLLLLLFDKSSKISNKQQGQ